MMQMFYLTDSMSVNLWAEFSRFKNKSSIRASKPLLISTSRTIIGKGDPPPGTKRSKELNMVGIRNMKSHVFFYLCNQIILHCVKDILEAKLNRFLLKSNVNLFHLSKVLYSVKKNPEFFNDWCSITAAKWQKMLITISGTEKTFHNSWFVDNQLSIITLFCRKLLCFIVNREI